MKHSIWEILNMAGGAMWVILALSVLAFAIVIERLIVQGRFMVHARALHDTVSRCLSRGALNEARSACERSRSALADVYLVGYERLGRTKKDHLESAVNRERLRVMLELKSRIWMLGTIGAIGVFVGLFGTVIGIMEAFMLIEETGRNEFAEVAGPIAEALYATAAGIMVAVMAVVLYNYFNQRLQRTAAEVKMLTDEFLELLDEIGPQPDRSGKSPGDGEIDGSKESADGSREAA